MTALTWSSVMTHKNPVIVQTWVISTMIALLIGVVGWQTARIIGKQDDLLEASTLSRINDIKHEEKLKSIDRRLSQLENYKW